MAKIYIIRNTTSPHVYVGSTEKQYLSSRFSQHKYDCRRSPDSPRSQIVSCPTSSIELLEECDVSVRYERERYWIENTPNCVNKQVPTSTYQEWVDRNKESVREYKRNWMREKRTDPAVLEQQRNQMREKRRQLKAST